MPQVEKHKLEEALNKQPFREGANSGQRREAILIEEGWGSSGYYSYDVLERDMPSAFPAGTHMYLDHPTVKEDKERPERSVRDLVGKTLTDPRMAGIASVSEVEIFPHWEPVIDALAEDIGLSIRAYGITEEGDAGGKHGAIVNALTEGVSIDYVTKAGAGGRLGPLIESARAASDPPDSELVEAANTAAQAWDGSEELQEAETLYDEFLERDVSKAERIALAKKGQAIPIKNGDGEIVGGRFPMANCEDVKAAAMSVGRTQMGDIKGFIKRVASKLSCPVPFKEAAPAARPEEGEMPELKEQLSEAQNRVRQLEGELKERTKERDDANTRAERAEDALRLKEAATIVASEVSQVEGLPQRAAARAIEAALREDIPTDSDGNIQKDSLRERARAKAKEEQDYLAGVTGRGNVRGMGESGSSGSDEKGEKELAEALSRHLGVPEKVAQRAAEGR
jgi:hypothetical protein